MTIKEKAKAYADNYVVGDFAIIVDLIHKVAEESYIAGATEQKAIDIDKACEWLKDNTKEYVEWGGYELVPAMLQNFYKAFRKAMEE